MSYSLRPLGLLLIVAVLALSVPEVKAQDYPYCEVLTKSLLFYQAQRSGRLPDSTKQAVPWRGDSALGDCTTPCTTLPNGDGNLVGGYYDAGDNMKFGFPFAYSITMLSWGLLANQDAVAQCGQVSQYLDAIRWGTDYLIEAHTSANELWGQVGNGEADHSYWGPPETMTMARPSYKIDTSNPGTDLAMETAAAMAAASIVFRSNGDATYADQLLSHARQLHSFGDTYRGIYSDSITDAANFYKSWSGWEDELVWGSVWLYKATGEDAFLYKARSDYATLSVNKGPSHSWDNKYPGTALLLWQITSASNYQNDIQQVLDAWLPGGGITYTPGGLAWLMSWGPLRYSTTAAFLALLYGGDNYISFGKAQIDYPLGTNPSQRSYVCGFGNNPPINPHHRGAHGSTDNNIDDPVNNLHILYGAMVGGPDANDYYVDDRHDYVKNEVALDYNAGFTAAIAVMVAKFGGGGSTPTPASSGSSGSVSTTGTPTPPASSGSSGSVSTTGTPTPPASSGSSGSVSTTDTPTPPASSGSSGSVSTTGTPAPIPSSGSSGAVSTTGTSTPPASSGSSGSDSTTGTPTPPASSGSSGSVSTTGTPTPPASSSSSGSDSTTGTPTPPASSGSSGSVSTTGTPNPIPSSGSSGAVSTTDTPTPSASSGSSGAVSTTYTPTPSASSGSSGAVSTTGTPSPPASSGSSGTVSTTGTPTPNPPVCTDSGSVSTTTGTPTPTPPATSTTGTPPGPPTPPPASSSGSDETIAYMLYDDGLAQGAIDWSWASHNFYNTYPVRTGHYSISFTPSWWLGLYIHAQFDQSTQSGVEFYVNGGGVGGQIIGVAIVRLTNGHTDAVTPFLSVSELAQGQDIPANGWLRCFISFDNVESAGSLDGIMIQDFSGREQANIYIDDMAVLSR